jgi:N-acetyl-anhydromuramyl-L-alanine amidase AmpD
MGTPWSVSVALPFPHHFKPSPNRDPMEVHERLGVCFHRTTASIQDTVANVMSPASKVSYHCLIDRDGTRRTFVRDEHVAWHLDDASFHGRKDCNNFLLGCAFAGEAPFTSEQIDSALEWLDERWSGNGWSADWITDHRQIAPHHPDELKPAEWGYLIAAIKERFTKIPS